MAYPARKIILTEDGSPTISIPEMNVCYHSIHGAIQESKHVFIEAGLKYLINQKTNQAINIFESGLGTGLNVLLTYIETQKRQMKVYYEAIEPFPLDAEEVKLLHYCRQLNQSDLQTIFEQLHVCGWETKTELSSLFTFNKTKTGLLNSKPLKLFHLIYFDAFDPKVQPELWSKEVFEKMFSILEPNGVLVTYSSKGTVRRAMHAAGFTVEKIQGAKGKREMIRAIK
jgi:tRNA U34 5-methylaminomethyl-2-thiouridine-forming methyltransferase MnmC